MGLLWLYLGRVFAFTFRGSVRHADSWQIVAGGTAVPSILLGIIFGVVGQDMPNITPAEWATFFGYGLITWLLIRFLVAPFFIWREQYEESTELRTELSKPERMVMERLSKHRAKARAKLAASLEDFQTLAFASNWDDAHDQLSASKMSKCRKLQAEAGLSEAFETARLRLTNLVVSEGKKDNSNLPLDRISDEVLKLMQSYLMGDITAEILALRLPPYTELEKQP